MKHRFLRNTDPVIIFIALANIGVRFLFYDNLEYHRDDLLYFALGTHPAFGYETVPPLTGWVAMMMQFILDGSLFAVRAFPSFLSGVMVLLTASIARELGSSRYGALLAVTGLSVSGFFMRTFFLFHPVHLEVFLWTLCIWQIIKYINTSAGKYLVFFGIAAGFAMLNKYLSGLFFIGLLVIVPFTQYRKIFAERDFRIGMIAGALLFLPNLIWQITKGLPALNHISKLYDTQLVHMDAGTFLIDQLTAPMAASLLTVAGLIFLLSSAKMIRYRFLAFLAIFVIGMLLLLKGKGYYTLGVFPFMIAAGAAAFDAWIKVKAVRIAIPLIIIILNLPSIPYGLPVFDKDGLKQYFVFMDEEMDIDIGRRWEDGTIRSLPQDYADMIGWEELVLLTDSAYRMVDDRNAVLIYGENYGHAGAITVIGRKYGLPCPVSFHESFRYWIPVELKTEITSFIYINHHLGEDVEMLYGKITVIGSVSDKDAREYGATVYLCEQPVTSFNEFWEQRISNIR